VAPIHLVARGALLGSMLVLMPVGIVAAGAPARVGSQALPAAGPIGVDLQIDRSSLPEVSVTAEAAALNTGAPAPATLAVALAEALAIEGEAMRRGDTSLLRFADDGERLLAMEREIQAAATAGRFPVRDHTFDALRLEVVFTDGPQGGATLALASSGTVEQVTYDAAGIELERARTPFRSTFVMRPGPGGRWVIISEVDRS
jgi:hypothetical protein